MDDYEKQDKQKIGKGDTVRITKARKNEEGEWNVKIFVNGKNYKPAEIFADSKDDAELQAKDAKDLYKRKGATVIGEKGSAKKEEKEEPDFEEPSLKEEILALSGVVLSEEKMKNGFNFWEKKNDGYYIAKMIYGVTLCVRKTKGGYEYDVSTEEYTYYNGVCGTIVQAKNEAYARYIQLLENHKKELIKNKGC